MFRRYKFLTSNKNLPANQNRHNRSPNNGANNKFLKSSCSIRNYSSYHSKTRHNLNAPVIKVQENSFTDFEEIYWGKF